MKRLIITVFVTLFAVNVMAAPVNINSADAKTISDALSGIGPKKAEDIIKYREKEGPFKAPEDLVKVPGIGEKTVQKNIKDILISDAEAPAAKQTKN
jgi:competence protein ComEA